MIIKKNIISNLKVLNSKYRKARTPTEALLYSKLAILELCGWIEESMDELVLSISKKCIKKAGNQTIVKNIIKRTYGFEYQNNFCGMLMRIIGLIGIERLENKIDNAKLYRFKTVLSNLKTMRDSMAHTHIRGVTITINAPSTTLVQFEDVYSGLIEIDRFLKKEKFKFLD